MGQCASLVLFASSMVAASTAACSATRAAPFGPGRVDPRTANGPSESAAATGTATIGDADASIPQTNVPSFRSFALPGASGHVSIDYIAYEPGRSRVWIPVADTGSVDVFDIATQAFLSVGGFETTEKDGNGAQHGKRVLGPSSVAIGDGFAYVGNRADNRVCAIEMAGLKKGSCVKLASPPDGVAYVSSAREVWVTTPGDESIVVIDVSQPDTLALKTTIRLDGKPEGYGSDDGAGGRRTFFTNLEDRDRTVSIDVAGHKLHAEWSLGCDSKGPRGVAADSAHGLVFVACTDHIEILDGARGGLKVATFDAGAGIDNIAWARGRRLLYVAAGKAARVTVTHIDEAGHPTEVTTVESSRGVRTIVADEAGNAYAADAENARFLMFPFAR